MRAFAFLLLWYFNTISKYFYCICKYEYLIKPLLNFSSSQSVSKISPRAKRAHCMDPSELQTRSAHLYLYTVLKLFRERLSEKVHATIPKGIVGGFEFTVKES